MSHRALRRVVVRLLHDPLLVGRLRVDPDGALAGVDVTATERDWLLAVPAAAWRTDPERPRRVLAALRDEYPASLALAPARAEGFFASTPFHRTLQERGSLAVAFGEYLAHDAAPNAAGVARLEQAMAAVRRAARRPAASPTGSLRLAPRVRLIRAPAGTSALLTALCVGRPPGDCGPGEEILLIERDPRTAEVRVEYLEPDLAALLEHAMTPIERARLLAVACGLGATGADAVSVVNGLVADAILI